MLCGVTETKMHIDTTLDLRLDAGGKDPDRYSATARAYHR
jgi:hypothetical protein